MAENEKTSQKIGRIAAILLRDPKTPKKVRQVAASDFTQLPDKIKHKKAVLPKEKPKTDPAKRKPAPPKSTRKKK